MLWGGERKSESWLAEFKTDMTKEPGAVILQRGYEALLLSIAVIMAVGAAD